jgi:hypothetical protein
MALPKTKMPVSPIFQGTSGPDETTHGESEAGRCGKFDRENGHENEVKQLHEYPPLRTVGLIMVALYLAMFLVALVCSSLKCSFENS